MRIARKILTLTILLGLLGTCSTSGRWTREKEIVALQRNGFTRLPGTGDIWKQDDVVNGKTWYRHPGLAPFPFDFYIGKQDGEKWMVLSLWVQGVFPGAKWDAVIFSGRGTIFPIPVLPGDIEWDDEDNSVDAQILVEHKIAGPLLELFRGTFNVRLHGGISDHREEIRGCAPCVDLFEFYMALPESPRKFE